jgi:hypothetical protein
MQKKSFPNRSEKPTAALFTAWVPSAMALYLVIIRRCLASFPEHLDLGFAFFQPFGGAHLMV